MTENDAFAFLKADSDGDYITYAGFCEALRQVLLSHEFKHLSTFCRCCAHVERNGLNLPRVFCYLYHHSICEMMLNVCTLTPQLNLIGHCYGLSAEEIKDLWLQADIDGNGVLDYSEFQVLMLNALEILLIVFVLELFLICISIYIIHKVVYCKTAMRLVTVSLKVL